MDSKWRRSTIELAESPNRLYPKPKPDNNDKEADINDINQTKNWRGRWRGPSKVWVYHNDKYGWTFNSWMEVTQNWNDIPKETNDMAQPFLLEDTREGKDDENLACQIWEHLEAEMSMYKDRSKGFNQVENAIKLRICLSKSSS
jgi:hypothetical protein